MNIKQLCGWIPPCYLLLQPPLASAEVITDGTLGTLGRVPLSAPNYTIAADLGQQLGGNLFHSFSQFNLKQGETATFAGPNSVTNIVSRVTGGSRSDIDGTIRSEIPGANLLFINPMGFLFGPHASLDVTGAVHVSTANHLKLGENGRFDASHPENSILSVAPPSAFGFLGQPPVSIIVQEGKLSAPSISLVGGNQTITGNLIAPHGRILLHTVTTAGEVSVNPEETARLELGGDLSISQNANLSTETLSVDSEEAARLKLGGYLSILSTETNSAIKAGDIFIRAGNLKIGDNAHLSSSTRGSGDAGKIDIKANHFTIKDSAALNSNTYGKGSGQGGTLRIETNSFEMYNETLINTSSDGTSRSAGQVIIITGDFKMFNNSGIYTASEKGGSGNGGDVNINARRFAMTDTSKILSSTFNSGQSGKIYLTTGTLSLAGQSAIASTTFGSGPGGDIHIQVQDLSLSGSAVIDSSTQSKGAGGNINLQVGQIVVTDIATISAASGGDNVFLREIKNLAELADRLGAESNGDFSGGGQAGKVCISRGGAGAACNSESIVVLAKTVTEVPQLRNCPDRGKNNFVIGKPQGVGRLPEDLF